MIVPANVAQAIVKLVASRGLPAVMGNLVMGNLVNRDFEPSLASAGDTVNVPIPPLMAANNIAAGGSVQVQARSLGNAQVVLNRHIESTFQIPDVTAALVGAANGNFDLLDKFLTPAIIALAEQVETDLLSLYTNLTANSDVGTANTALVESVIDAAEAALFDAKVPETEQKNLVVSSSGYAALRQLPRFSERQTIGDSTAIVKGKVGEIKGMNVFRSQFVHKVSTTTYNMAFGKNAMALVVRRLPKPMDGTGAIVEYAEMGNFGVRVVMSYAPNTLAQQFTVDILYGVGVLRGIHGVRVLS